MHNTYSISIKKSSALIANQSFYCYYMERFCVWLIYGVSLQECI